MKIVTVQIVMPNNLYKRINKLKGDRTWINLIEDILKVNDDNKKIQEEK